MQYGIIMLIAGLLAAPQLIAGKSKHAEEALKKFAPWQGWIGLVLFVWGVWTVISAIINIGWLADFPVWWITLLAVALLQVALGMILGFNVITEYILSKNAHLKAKGEMLHKKLVPKQKVLGILGVILGIWAILAHFIR